MKTFFSFLICCFLFTPAFAAEGVKALTPAQQKALDGFTQWDKNLKTASLSYDQSTTFEGMLISASAGRIYKKDNMIRLDTLENGKVTQSALTDKKIITIKDEKGKPITNISWREWQDSQANKALFDFGNYAALLKTHNIKEFTQTPDGWRIIFTPAEGAVYDLEFLLNDKDYFPAQISITSEGVKTKTLLKDIRKNTDIKEGVFK